MSDPRDGAMLFHFVQSNPEGPGQGNVPTLLRRVADTIESLGDIEVYDVTFSSTMTEDEDELTMVVYYDREEPE